MCCCCDDISLTVERQCDSVVWTTMKVDEKTENLTCHHVNIPGTDSLRNCSFHTFLVSNHVLSRMPCVCRAVFVSRGAYRRCRKYFMARICSLLSVIYTSVNWLPRNIVIIIVIIIIIWNCSTEFLAPLEATSVQRVGSEPYWYLVSERLWSFFCAILYAYICV